MKWNFLLLHCVRYWIFMEIIKWPPDEVQLQVVDSRRFLWLRCHMKISEFENPLSVLAEVFHSCVHSFTWNCLVTESLCFILVWRQFHLKILLLVICQIFVTLGSSVAVCTKDLLEVTELLWTVQVQAPFWFVTGGTRDKKSKNLLQWVGERRSSPPRCAVSGSRRKLSTTGRWTGITYKHQCRLETYLKCLGPEVFWGLGFFRFWNIIGFTS